MSNDVRPTSPPLPQSWFSTVAAVGDDPLPDEPPTAPPPAKPAPAGLDWKSPSRVRVPVFERDGAPENTTPASAPATLVDACIGHVDATADDQTVHQLSAALAAQPDDQHVVDAEFAPDFQEVRREPADLQTVDVPGVGPVRMHPGNVDFQEVASGPTAADCVARFQDVVRFAPPDEIPPPKGAQAAQAPADPCGRDDATPNDGVVAPRPDEGFRCALWSNDMLEMRTSDGEHILLNSDDTRALLRYVGDKLSARARAAA